MTDPAASDRLDGSADPPDRSTPSGVAGAPSPRWRSSPALPAFAVPADLVTRDSSGSSWNGLFFAVVLVGFGLGGAVAGGAPPSGAT